MITNSYAGPYDMLAVRDSSNEEGARVTQLLLTLPEVGRVLSISRSKVYQLLNSNSLPSVYIGRSRRVRRSDVEEFVRLGGVKY